MGLGENPKFPVKGHGPAYNQSVIGDFTLRIGGSGLVATVFGFPGLSATRVGTGVYDLRYPQTVPRGVRFFLQPEEVVSPTGAAVFNSGSGSPVSFTANVSHVGGESGVAYLNTSRSFPTLTAVNPPTGAIINGLVIGSPITRY